MNKCKKCLWHNKPYWSVINPCDNCPYENDDIQVLTRWQDPTIDELQQRIDKAIEFIESYGKNTALWECDKNNLLKILKGSEE